MESISSMKSSLKNGSNHVREHMHHSRWVKAGHDKRLPDAHRRFHSQKSLPNRNRACSDSSDLRFRSSSATFLKQNSVGRHPSAFGFRKPPTLHIDRSEPNIRSFSPRKSSFDHETLRTETPKSTVPVQNPRSASSTQKIVGNGPRRPDRRQVPTPKTSSGVDQEASSLRSPIPSTNSAENLCPSKISVHHASPLRVSESDKISPRQPERAGSRTEPSKLSPKQDRYAPMEKDCKRASKVSPKPLSEPGQAKKEGTRRLVISSPRKPIATSDDVHCRKNNSSAKDRDEKETPEPTHDMERVDILISFRHVTRKARSERKREDAAKVQISEDVSLDGFSLELEQAILKKMENEMDTALEETTSKKQSAKEETASKDDFSMDSNKRDSEVGSKDLAMREAQLDGDISVRRRRLKKVSRLQERRPKSDDAATEEMKPRKPSSDELMISRKCEANDIINAPSLPGNASKLPFPEEIASETEEGEVKPERLLAEATASNAVAEMQVDIHADTNPQEGEASEGYLNGQDGVQTMLRHRISDSQKTDEGISGNIEAILMRKGDSLVEEDEGRHHDLSQHNGSHAQIRKDGESLINTSVANSICTETVTPHVLISEELMLSLSMRPTDSHKVASSIQSFSQSKVGYADCSHEKEIVQAEEPVKFPVHHVKELDDLADHDHRQKKLKTECLQLTLALPVASLSSSGLNPELEPPVKGHHSLHTDCSKSLTLTESDAFMSSMQESSFQHNPSCSLQHSSYEHLNITCGESRPFATFDWSNHKSHQKKTGSDRIGIDSAIGFSVHKKKHDLFASERLILSPLINELNKDSSINEKNTQKVVEARTQTVVRPHDQQCSKDFPATNRPQIQSEDLGHPAPFTKRCDNGVSYEKIGLREVSSEPVLVMAQKLQELPDSFLEGLKDSVKELLGDFAKRDEFLILQKIIQERKDLTEETLLRAHPTQLDILVALKTGMQAFVDKNTKSLTYKALIEIFLQKRCRNVACQQSVPVDGCECTICSQKNGFCHDCMCMVCSKFDSDNHTSRWVGCDVCMHWCHTDCGLRMSYIKPTPTIINGIRSSQIQFKCLSCSHDMELFGFVKEVFNKSAQRWDSEALAKELDCVRRIFHGSEDMGGQELYWKAEEMLQMLESNVDANYVRNSMLQFFSESCIKPEETDAGQRMSSKIPKETCKLSVETKMHGSQELFVRSEEGNETDTVHDPIKSKNKLDIKDPYVTVEAMTVEAASFQVQADKAHGEAMRLHHILSKKRKMLEEDSSLKDAELRLEEVAERRKKQLEVLQMLESSLCEYQRMKTRIESDMKILMTKMSKRQS